VSPIPVTSNYDYISQNIPTGEPATVEHPALSRSEADPTQPTWPLGQAKARFSEVVRLARSGRPQAVTVHGRDAVVVVATSEFERLTAHETSPTLHGLLSGSPLSRVADGALRPARSHRGGE